MPTKAVTIIGCRVNKDMLVQTEKTRLCKQIRYMLDGVTPRQESDLEGCQLETSGIDYEGFGEDFQVCPFCITPPYRTDHNVLYDTDNYTIDATFNGQPMTLNVVRSRKDDQAEWFVGLIGGEADEDGSTVFIDDDANIPMYRNQLKSILQPRGLWREHAFGVHTVLVVR